MKLTKVILALVFLLAFSSANTWARGGGGCFKQGTLIDTPNGAKAIEQLHRGDWVFGDVNGKYQTTQIVTTTKIYPDSYYKLTFPTTVVEVTGEHLFAVKNGVFQKASNLKPGDHIITWYQHQWAKSRILNVERVKAEKPAYNFLVNAGATYIANGLLAHNKGCFLPNTSILRGDGTSIAISQIKPGDTVKAYETNGKVVTTRVHAVIKHLAHQYYVVTTEKAVLNVTGEHPFFIGKDTFKTVAALKVGDIIYAFDGKQLSSQRINEIESVNTDITVYNLQTDEPHTYFAAGIAVHNKGGGCFPAGTKIDTPDGLQSIELLAPGDAVISINHNGAKFVSHVQSIYATRSPILTIKTDLGELQTTTEHPIARVGGDFVDAENLALGESILFEKNGHLTPASIQSIDHASETLVFNLAVQSPHTFIADNFLVHNKGGYGGGGRSSSCRPGDSVCETINIIPLIIYVIFIILLNYFFSSKDKNLDYLYSRDAINRKADKTLKLLEFLAKQDESVMPDTLEKRVVFIFLNLQQCWMDRNYDPMKPLLMSALYKLHLAQLAGMIHNHEVNKLLNLKIDKIDIVNIRYTEKKFQREFTALITATCRDYYIDDRTGNYIRGDKQLATFQEFWTFQYQETGWLLREIEQAGESSYLKDENFVEQFTDLQIAKIYGVPVDQLGKSGPWLAKNIKMKQTQVERMLNFLAESDDMWVRQGMNDRVRLIFTNVHLALEAGQLKPDVEAQLFPAVAADLKETLTAWNKAGKSIEYRNFCIRKIEILLVQNFDDKSRNQFTARVSAHAKRVQLQNGKIITQDKDVTPFEEYWTFGCRDNEWKLKEVQLPVDEEKIVGEENIDEGSSPNLVKWYYTKKRVM